MNVGGFAANPGIDRLGALICTKPICDFI